MMKYLCIVFILCSFSGNAQLLFNNTITSLGTIAEAAEIKGDVVVTNASSKKIYLLRADADQGVKVYASKKTLQPQDTALLVISFIPESDGRFKKAIRLVSSDKATPYELELSGTLSKLVANNKTACYYFGSRRNNNVKIKEEPIVINEPEKKRDVSNKIPDNPEVPVTVKQPTMAEKPVVTPVVENPDELSVAAYKPNNILFLVDVSGSMKDSLKLPLMKEALHVLINAVREVDYISFVTYADSTKVICEGIKGSDKKTLNAIVNGLKAHGLTKGNKAILFSQQLAQKHFIAGGNNQVILATDGKFRFYPDDRKTWNTRQAGGKIIMSTVAFGSDRDAMKNLKEIAREGEGSFIHIKKRHGSRNKLLDEIKERSRK